MAIIPKPIRQPREHRGLKRGLRIKPIGRRGREWDAARRRVRERLDAAGIRSCEFGFVGCWKTEGLSLAHAVKRRYLQRNAEVGSPYHIETCAIACMPVCHKILDEQMSAPMMLEQVMAAIARRAA